MMLTKLMICLIKTTTKENRRHFFMHMLSVSPIVFIGERCFIAGHAVNLVFLCEAVCQEDETYEPVLARYFSLVRRVYDDQLLSASPPTG